MTEIVCPVCQSPVDDGTQTCPVCHFKLAGATQRFKPLSREEESAPEEPVAHRATLKMVRGPQVGAVYSLDSDLTTIGRNPNCDIFLNDMTVSREHAEIKRHADAFIISDLQSFNGVWINNRTVMEHALRSGDYVQIGKYDFVYEESDGAGEEAQR